MHDTAYRGRCFLYALVAGGAEDLLKVGLTHDPLARWSSFHLRWFEVFDLEHSMLVETETRADAQRLETRLHRALAEHRCPVPLTMRAAAGGSTEWYRGASAAVGRFFAECRQQGYLVHLQARPWLIPAMAEAQVRLDGIVRAAFEAHCAGGLAPHQLDALRAMVDSHRAFGTDVEGQFPGHVRAALGLG